MNELLPKLLAEDRLIRKFAKPKGNALNSESNQKKQDSKNKYKGKRNENKNKEKKNFQAKSSISKDFEEYKRKEICMLCDQPGHIKKNCPKLKSNEEQKQNVKDEESNVAVSIIAETNLSVSSEEWILDSGATEHMTYDKSGYNNFKTLTPQRVVRFGNNQLGFGTGIGDIIVISKIGESNVKLILRNVPQLRRKLISVAAATSSGCFGQIQNDKIIIRDKQGKSKLVAKKDGNLYVAQLRQIE